MRNKIVLPALLAASLAVTATTATADDLEGPYAGIGIGSTSIDDGLGLDDRDTSFKVFAGYSFNKYFAVELAYLDGGTGRQSDAFFSADVFPSDSSIDAKVDTKLLNLSVIGQLPVTESFSLFGKLGYARIDLDTKVSLRFGNQQFTTRSEDLREDLSYGAGATYSFGKSFQLRAEYEGFELGRGDLSSVTLSGIFRF